MKFTKEELNRIKELAEDYDVDYQKLKANIAHKIDHTAVRSNRKKYYTEFTDKQKHDMVDLLLYKLEGDMICPCCGKDMQIFSNGHYWYDAWSIDHRVELSAGGTNDLENLQVICGECNLGKEDKVKPVIATDKDGNTKYYKTMMEAVRKLNKHGGQPSISAACNGKIKSAYGFKWRFATAEEIADHFVLKGDEFKMDNDYMLDDNFREISEEERAWLDSFVEYRPFDDVPANTYEETSRDDNSLGWHQWYIKSI